MNKKVVIALLILAVSAIVMILTRGDAPINLVFDTFSPRASLVYLVWMGIGVLIGGLLI